MKLPGFACYLADGCVVAKSYKGECHDARREMFLFFFISMFLLKESTLSAAVSPREEEGMNKGGIYEGVGSAERLFSVIIREKWVR